MGSETVYSCKYTSFKVFIALVSLLHIDLASLYTKHPFMHSEKKKSRDIYMIYNAVSSVEQFHTPALFGCHSKYCVESACGWGGVVSVGYRFIYNIYMIQMVIPWPI